MIIPQELKSPTRVNKYMYLYDFVFIISYFLFFSMLGSGIHEVLKLPYYAYNLITAFLLTRSSRSNPQKRIYESIFYQIIRLLSEPDPKMPSAHCRIRQCAGSSTMNK